MRPRDAITYFLTLAPIIDSLASDALVFAYNDIHFPTQAICKADTTSVVQAFNSNNSKKNEALHACYTVVATDHDACVTEIWRRPRFSVLMKRVDKTHSKLKIVTNEEVIEAENYLNEAIAKDRELIRLKIDGQLIPYNAYSIAWTEVNNLCTVNFVANLTGVELQNTDFWIRFNGTLLEMRLRKTGEQAVCGWCGGSANNVANVRAQLSESGLLKDEYESCRLRATNPPE